MAAFLALLGLVPLSNLLTDQTPDPWWNGAALEWIVLTVLVLAIAYALAAALGPRLDRWSAALESRVLVLSPRAFAFGCAALAFTLAAANALFAFRRHWVYADEAVAMWHGRMLLSGHLWVPADPDAVFFAHAGSATGERWFSVYPIGGPLVAAIGDATHMRWLIGPALTGLGVYAFYRFAARAYDERTARGATLLLAVCGYLVMMGATLMTHAESLALVAIALAGLAAWATATSAPATYRSAAVIGASLATAVAFRPYDAALGALVIGAFQLTALRGSPWRARSLAVQVLAGLVPLALVLASNVSMTGHPFVFGYEAINGSIHDPGFHDSPYGFEHSPLRGVMLASSYLMLLNHALIYSPIPALLLAAIGLLAMRRVTRWDALVFAMIVVFVVGYGAYWFDGRLFGPRFLYPVVPLFVLLVARAPGLVRQEFSGTAARATRLVIPLCLAYAWLLANARFGLLAAMIQQREGTNSSQIDVARVVRDSRVHHALVFVPTAWPMRQFARMVALHLAIPTVQQFYLFADACQLEHALRFEEERTDQPAERVKRMVAATNAADEAPVRDGPGGIGQARLRSLESLTPDCAAELRVDSVRSMRFEEFIPFFTFDRDGHLSGDVIFAHDMGPLRNERLRARFADRAWYRIRYAAVPGGATIIPYAGSPKGTDATRSP